jgi:hypothetical protein
MSAATPPPGASQGIVPRASPYAAAETRERLEAVLWDKGLTLFAGIDGLIGAALGG